MTTVRRKLAWWTGGALAAVVVVYNFPPAENTFYPRCPFYAGTHLLCPGCGGTRALYALLHLNLRGAFHWNALLTVLAPLVLMWFGWSAYQALRFGRFPEVPWPRTVALVFGIFSLLFAVARNTGIAFTI